MEGERVSPARGDYPDGSSSHTKRIPDGQFSTRRPLLVSEEPRFRGFVVRNP